MIRAIAELPVTVVELADPNFVLARIERDAPGGPFVRFTCAQIDDSNYRGLQDAIELALQGALG